jgi:hypothetical protein
MISVEDQALLLVWAKMSGVSRGNVLIKWRGLLPEEREAFMDQARKDLT